VVEEVAGAGTQRSVAWDVGLDFAALFAGLPTAYLVMSPDLVIVEANAAYTALLGRTREGLIGRPVFEAFPPTADALDAEGRNPLQVSFERARDSRRPDALPLFHYDVVDQGTGVVAQRCWSLISAPLLDAQGATSLILQRVEDVTDYVREREGHRADAERGRAWAQRVAAVESDLYARVRELKAAQDAREVTARRLARLGEVALALTAAQTVEDLEQIVIGRGLAVLGADGGAVVTHGEDGGWRATVSASLGEDVQRAYATLPFDSPLPACWTARSGERLLLPTVASALAFDPVMASVLSDTGRRGWACLPLGVRGQSLGSLAVSWVEEHDLSPEESDLLDGFAAQCTQALQRIQSAVAQAQAVQVVQQMSESLQRSLLSKPSTPPGVHVAVRYHPAAHEAQVGGDWYDAFTATTGSTLVAVGDIAGHDREAAATMGQVRNLLRGMAYDSTDGPAALLTRLDGALAGLELDTLATAVVGRLEQSRSGRIEGSWRFRWSNAGHPPPLLRQPDGRVEVLQDTADLLLGLDPATSRSERLVTVPTGAVLVLYTDGLVERRDASLDDGIAHLVAVLAGSTSTDPDLVADELLGATDADSNEDDIAVLVLGLDAPRRWPGVDD
jgi:serine phosphatase RsbU (regulator of sigma subunit)